MNCMYTPSGEEPTCQGRRPEMRVRSLGREGPPWRRAWPPTPVFQPAESQGQRSLAGCSPRTAGSDTTEVTQQAHTCAQQDTACLQWQ